MTDFFKQLVGLAGYGLVGIAIVMVVVLAYVVIKKPNNKFAIIILTVFCMFVIGLFTYAGVGVVKENKQIESHNEVLKDSARQLTDSNRQLKNNIKVTDAKLNIATLQYALNKPDLSKDSLSNIIKTISSNLDTLSLKDNSAQKNDWSRWSTDYKGISEKLNKNEFNINEAKHELMLNNEKLIISGKTRRIER
jgi:hypothetical protein